MFTQTIVLGALTGLASSAHCAAMCGPLAASVCTQRAPRSSLLRYQLGRTAAYGFAGALAGSVGHLVALSSSAPALRLAMPLLTALALIALAVRVLRGDRAKLVQLTHGARAPSLFQRIARLAPRDPSALGALSVFLPCGALAAALVLAASTQTRAGGAFLMLGFAATSALGVVGGGIVLARVAQLGGRIAPRVLAITLFCAAFYVALRPVYVRFHAAEGAPVTASCH